VIVDMLLSSLVQSVQKLVKLILGLATEHGQQLVVLSERSRLRTNDITLFCGKNAGLIKFTDKSRMFDIQTVHQENVILSDGYSVITFVFWTYVV